MMGLAQQSLLKHAPSSPLRRKSTKPYLLVSTNTWTWCLTLVTWWASTQADCTWLEIPMPWWGLGKEPRGSWLLGSIHGSQQQTELHTCIAASGRLSFTHLDHPLGE
jgi:hypothetical protein